MQVNQLVRILQQELKAGETPEFRPANSLAFPASGVSNYTPSNGRPYVELSFLGLYGVSSPLPHYFITDALDEDNVSLRRFLGVFNQIIYLAYFYAWQQKHPHLFHDTALRGHSMVCALAAIDSENNESLSRVAPFFLTERRNFHGLSAILFAHTQGVDFTIKLIACDWINVLQPARLGQGRLSDNLTLGPRIPAHAQRICICLGPVRETQARLLSPSGSQGKSLLFSVNHYLNHTKNIDLEITIVHDKPHCQLGRSMSLGWNSFLNSKKSITTKKYKIISL